METLVRRKLEMGRKALAFGRANADADAGYIAALDRLEQYIERAAALEKEQRAGTVAERGANRKRRELREHVQQLLLSHLQHVAAAASQEEPTVARELRVPSSNESYEAFRTVAGAVFDAAQGQKELLVRYGLGQAQLDDLTQSLVEFDEMTAQAAAGRLTHVRTRHSLREVLRELVIAVRVVGDSIRHRFRSDPGVIAAWATASNIFGPVERAGDEVVGTPEPPSAETPTVPLPAPVPSPAATSPAPPSAVAPKAGERAEPAA